MTKQELLLLLDLAVGEPIGLLLRCSSAEKARAALYSARAASGDPRFVELQFRISPFPDGDLVICRAGRAQVVPQDLFGPEEEEAGDATGE